MLKRIWTGDLSKEDCKVINSRVIGYNGLKLSPVFEGKQSENIFNQCIHKRLNKRNFYSGIEKNDKTFYSKLENYDLLILSATSKEMLAMHVQLTKNATPYKSNISKTHTNNTPKYN